MRLFLLFVCVFIASCSHLNNSPISTTTSTSETLKVLLVDGQNNHTVWPKSTFMLKQYLEDSGLFEVDVYRSKLTWRGEKEMAFLNLFSTPEHRIVPEPETDPTFAPDFTQYDVVVSNFGYKAADWPVATQRSFERYMSNGGGFVAIHAANNSFPTWDAYNLMNGLGGWGGRDESNGPYVFFDEQGNLVKDLSPGLAGAHGTKHEFQIQLRNEHPIVSGLPKVWMHTKDECYGKLRGPAKNMLILASALCPKEEKGTGQHEPMLMVIDYGQGRIFNTTLGHQQESYESVGFITTFLRGTEWAASGRVTQAIPADFPTAEKSSSRQFD
ncbi:MAG: ThuA domain-containing protein [Glaciecola sp.]|jgi:hypothetical protein